MAGKQADIKVGVLTNYDSKGLDQAKTGLSGFSASIKDADGVGGKFAAGWGNIKDQVSAHAGALALAGGAALVTFGVKAIGAFTDTAKAALDLSSATGLAVEDASRWIGVGDDYKVGADQLTSSIGKIGKQLDDTKWAKYGIATRDAGGAARDVNDILLDSLTTLSDTKNETERARIGNELFGKGYANLSPLIGHTRSEYEKMLGSVEKGQVITAKEAASAEKMRLAQDQLADALKEVELQAGQALTKLSPLLVGIAKFINLSADAFGPGGIAGGGGFTQIHDALDDMDKQIKLSGHDFDWWQKQIMEGKTSIDEAVKSLNEFSETTTNSQTSTEGYSYALQDAAESATEAEQAVRNSTNAVDGYSYAAKDATDTVNALQSRNKMMTDDLKRGLDADKAAMDHLLGVVNDDESWLNLQTNIAETTALFDENGKVIVKKGEDGAQALRDAALAVDEVKKNVIQYGAEVLGLPTQKITDIVAAVDPQNLADIEALLANLTRNRNVSLSIQAKGGAGYNDTGGPSFDDGGMVGGPVGAPVAATVHGGEMVLTPEQQSSVGGATTINIHMPVGSSGADVVNELKKHVGRNGVPDFLRPVGGVSGGRP